MLAPRNSGQFKPDTRSPAARIDSLSIPEPNSGCWLWHGTVDTSRGYGVIIVKQRRVRAHRFSYEAFKGSIPPGMCVCHACDNPPCVNPDHLFLGTNADNVADRCRKGRSVTRRGSQRPDAKVNEADVTEMRRLRKLGFRNIDIASHFGISTTQASLICNGLRWRHVEHA